MSRKPKNKFIYHSLFLIADPLKLIVTLKGEAKEIQSIRAGIYILGPNAVNGKPHWLQHPGSNAIWFNNEKGSWCIGNEDILGGIRADISSTDKVASPHKATTWQYSNGSKWIISDDILVETFVEPGTYK